MLDRTPRRAPAWLTAGDTVDDVVGHLKTGKEAEVFVVERRSLDGDLRALLAHKRYRPRSTVKGELAALGFSRGRTFTHDVRYRQGQRQRRSRDGRAVERRSDFGRRLLAEQWLDQEHELLGRAHAAGVTVPYPVQRTDDGVLLELLGDDQGAAPRLVDARLDAPQLQRAWTQLVDELHVLARAGIVHADLSPYNLLWWDELVWLIDFPQAVEIGTNAAALDLLHHDVDTVARWFTRRGVPVDGDAVFAELLADAL